MLLRILYKCSFFAGDTALREFIPLSELKAIERTSLSAFRIRSDRIEMIFEAATQDDITEWYSSDHL